MSWEVVAYSAVTEAGIYRNGSKILDKEPQQDFQVFAKEAYRSLNAAYPKFFKMDELCKLAFLTTEVLLEGQVLGCDGEDADVALVLGNRTSSIASDSRHVDTFSDRSNYFPSPAVFVYTLPNIMLGELCIRHQITGENTCFVMEQFDADFMHQYVLDLLEQEHYTNCITGWVDYSDESFNAHMYLIGKRISDNTDTIPFDKNFTNLIATRNG